MVKKALKTIFVFVIAFMLTGCGKTPSLNKIAEKINSNRNIKEFEEYGTFFKATAKKNKLTINVTTTNAETKETDKYDIEYTLKNNILSAKFDLEEGKEMGILYSTIFLIDSIETLHGYKEDEFLDTLNDNRIENYTLDKEGLLIKNGTNTLEVKIDISKKVPLLDFSNTYITTDELSDLKTYLTNAGSAQLSSGKIAFYKESDKNTATIYIAEKEKTTNNSLNSLLSIVEVMFNDASAAKYIKDNYKDISEGNKKFNGVNIELNIDKKSVPNSITLDNNEYGIMKVTIDKKVVKKNMK